jgi:pimeloyl-ACP methyl ester carboxylesterase
MAEDAKQAERSQHHRTFRQADAADRLLRDDFKALRDTMTREGIARQSIDLYLQPLSQPGALDAAINWYRASTIASANIQPIPISTLYIWGTADGTVGRPAAELTQKFVTGPYRFVQIEGGGHFIVDQFPDRVTQLLIEHFRGVSL